MAPALLWPPFRDKGEQCPLGKVLEGIKTWQGVRIACLGKIAVHESSYPTPHPQGPRTVPTSPLGRPKAAEPCMSLKEMPQQGASPKDCGRVMDM